MPARSNSPPPPTRRVILADGAALTLSAIRPSDANALRAAFQRLSPESRYLRFHACVRDLPPHLWRYLTEVDFQSHVAVVAKLFSRIVGVGRFIRVASEPASAEVAFVVADDFQQRGVGRLLRDALVIEAERRDLRTFVAYVLPENRGIRHLLAAKPRPLVLEAGREPGTIVARLPHAADAVPLAG